MSDYEARIAALLQALGIPDTYGADRQLEPQHEAAELVPVGLDVFGRAQRLAPAAAHAWKSMRDTAALDGIVLQLVSGFRDVDYQRRLIETKLARGLHIQKILASSAAPGFSEHHTGRAIDLTTPGCEPLEEVFERTAAFRWLQARSAEFGFRLSFPRNNPHGIVYEPWHWLHRP